MIDPRTMQRVHLLTRLQIEQTLTAVSQVSICADKSATTFPRGTDSQRYLSYLCPSGHYMVGKDTPTHSARLMR